MTPHYEDGQITLHHGDCREVLAGLPDCSVDSVVTDPPYELGFMGKAWDASGIAYSVEMWGEVLRVLKPGGHLCAFGGTRTYHRMACAIEDAGFEIRDSLHWVYSTGFPKSLNVNKAAKDFACQCDLTWDYGRGHPLSEHDVRSMREGHLSSPLGDGSSSGEVLLARMSQQSQPKYRTERSESKVGRGEQSSMEGWGDIQEGQGQLHWPEICEMPTGVSADGAQGRLHHGASVGDGAVGGQAFESDRSGEPHQSQPERQPSQESGVVSDERRSQTGGGWSLCVGCSKPILPEGLHTALKPAHEIIVLARRPLIGTVAQNVLAHGTGALNIDGARVGYASERDLQEAQALADLRAKGRRLGVLGEPGQGSSLEVALTGDTRNGTEQVRQNATGRWPANVIFDTEAGALLDEQSGVSKGNARVGPPGGSTFGGSEMRAEVGTWFGDIGGASRFFTSIDWNPEIDVPFRYIAKPSKRERNAGLDGLPHRSAGEMTDRKDGSAGLNNPRAGAGRTNGGINHHPTVKPLALMRWLVKLVTPPGGTVLEPFAGSGTTLMACVMEGFNGIGIELTDEYLPIIEGRVRWAHDNRPTQGELPL